MTAYLSPDALATALTTLLEQDFTHPALPGPIRIRELSGAQRIAAVGAARIVDDDEDAPTRYDDALYRALVVQQGVIAPVLGADQVARLANGRHDLILDLSSAILALSALTPEAMFFRNTRPDRAGASTPASLADSGLEAEPAAADHAAAA